ncbi:MAG: CsgG/HfaB family protein [Saprospiraceae bacterium]|nr:CsgG/HfaB family protein [Saprospiraceae bacterium]
MKFIILAFVFIILGCAPARIEPLPKPVTLDDQIDGLVNQIVKSLSQNQKSTIAVVEFSDLRGNVTDLGKYFSEELTTRLFLTQKFKVIERQLLNKIIDEQKLGVSGYIDDKTAASLGQILGIDAIATGTITDLGKSIKVNARLISTESGSVFSVASVNILKDETILKLINQTKPIISTNKDDKSSKSNLVNDESVFFYEDFSEIEEGLIPENWVGGSTLAVTPDTEGKKRNYLTNFKEGSHQFTIPNIDFPDDWKFDMQLLYSYSHNSPGTYNLTYKIGAIESKLDITTYYSWTKLYFNGIYIASGKPSPNQINLITIEKIGPVLKFFVNGEKIKAIRIDNFEKPTSIFFSSSVSFNIYKLEGIILE